MHHDQEWHRAQQRRLRKEGRDWDSGRPREAPSPGPWILLGVMVVVGLVVGLGIAHGLRVADRRGYERLMTSVGLTPSSPLSHP